MRANDYSPLQAMQMCIRFVGAKVFSPAYICMRLFSLGKCFIYASILKNTQKHVHYRHEEALSVNKKYHNAFLTTEVIQLSY